MRYAGGFVVPNQKSGLKFLKIHPFKSGLEDGVGEGGRKVKMLQ